MRDEDEGPDNSCPATGNYHEVHDDNEPCIRCGEYPAHYRLSARRRLLTRNERLQGLADSGIGTWEELQGER